MGSHHERSKITAWTHTFKIRNAGTHTPLVPDSDTRQRQEPLGMALRVDPARRRDHNDSRSASRNAGVRLPDRGRLRRARRARYASALHSTCRCATPGDNCNHRSTVEQHGKRRGARVRTSSRRYQPLQVRTSRDSGRSGDRSRMDQQTIRRHTPSRGDTFDTRRVRRLRNHPVRHRRHLQLLLHPSSRNDRNSDRRRTSRLDGEPKTSSSTRRGLSLTGLDLCQARSRVNRWLRGLSAGSGRAMLR